LGSAALPSPKVTSRHWGRVKVVFVLVFKFKRVSNRSNSESAASEIVSFSFHILFGKVISLLIIFFIVTVIVAHLQ
jgi:hypothetical protein